MKQALEKRKRLFVIGLLGGALLLALSPWQQAQADRPPAQQIEPGHLIIGTFLIHKDGLDATNAPAAEASMTTSSQGMYYKSEFADGAWCDIENAGDMTGITSQACKVVPDADIDRLKLTVEIDREGNPKNLRSVADVKKDIDRLTKDVADLEEENDELLADNKVDESIEITLKINDKKTEIDFLTALLAADPKAAKKQLAKIGNDAGRVAALPASQAEAQAAAKAMLEEQLQAARAAGDAAKVADLEKQLADLDQSLGKDDLLQEAGRQLAAVVAAAEIAGEEAGATDAALVQLAVLINIDAKLADLLTPEEMKSYLQTESEQLMEAFKTAADKKEMALADPLLAKLVDNGAKAEDLLAATQAAQIEALSAEVATAQAALDAAVASQDAALADALQVPLVKAQVRLDLLESGQTDQIADLKETQATLAAQIASPPKGVDPAVLQEVLDSVSQDLRQAEKKALFAEKQAVEARLSAAGKSAALEAARKDLTVAIQALEKQKYSAAELAALEQLKKQIEANHPNAAVLPVESVISEEIDVKLTMPPVIIDGRTLVHIRSVAESFGSVVVWSDADRSVTVSRENRLVFCAIDDPQAFANGQALQIDVPPKLVEQRTLVPLRFVIEGLGLDVNWDGSTQTVEIEGILP
ncbi:copper amine oxidase N-terminal domain-containing protein [Tumebacillus sp. DT12]|uniref:Copper amine oxidase N-terminal domain-containing protein n=1 Tax=Tumebacillus lacus TaxID=2995335 RepID=A0ABT3X062_9BACL|nr:copper amine oxidase N-terminal domain-containing protein [Tumebacillus lacus]MCX7570285.1 copper amine oxidase N-terminal domain-containing protein [Tumebacillus lacus]